MHAYLVTGLELSPKLIESLISCLPEDLIDKPTGLDRFTPREIVAHLADWEEIMREERLSKAITSSGSAIQARDEGERAIEMDYASTDLREKLARFASERAKTVEEVKNIGPDQVSNFVVHPERGEQTVEDLANWFLGHDIYHAEQLATLIRSLNKG